MRLPKQIIKHVGRIASTDPTRYASDAVKVTRCGELVTTEATDGRMLVRTQHVDKGSTGLGDVSMLLQASAMRAVKFPARTKTVVLTEGDNVEVLALSSRNENKFDDAVDRQMIPRATKDIRFPDVVKVIPDLAPKDCHVFAVNPKLLGTLLDVIAKVGTDENSMVVRFTCPIDGNGPIRIDALMDDVAMTGVIMPINMRAVNHGYTAPAEWTNTKESNA